jgi:hypothetical protein
LPSPAFVLIGYIGEIAFLPSYLILCCSFFSDQNSSSSAHLYSSAATQQGELKLCTGRNFNSRPARASSHSSAVPEDLPYVGDAITPQQMDCAGELLLYDDTMRRIYLPDTKAEGRKALRLFMFDLKMELVGEAGNLSTMLAQAPGSHTETLLVD